MKTLYHFQSYHHLGFYFSRDLISWHGLCDPRYYGNDLDYFGQFHQGLWVTLGKGIVAVTKRVAMVVKEVEIIAVGAVAAARGAVVAAQ